MSQQWLRPAIKTTEIRVLVHGGPAETRSSRCGTSARIDTRATRWMRAVNGWRVCSGLSTVCFFETLFWPKRAPLEPLCLCERVKEVLIKNIVQLKQVRGADIDAGVVRAESGERKVPSNDALVGDILLLLLPSSHCAPSSARTASLPSRWPLAAPSCPAPARARWPRRTGDSKRSRCR